MKGTILASLLLLAATTSSAQKIHFCDTTNVWQMLAISGDEGGATTSEHPLSYSGSTIFNGATYHQLGSSYVREDTVAGKVFIRYFNTMSASLDTADQLLYDYSWSLGDTVRYMQPHFPYTTAWVTAKDSTQIGGIWYKVWHFSGIDSAITGIVDTFNYNVIEGLGCTNGFDYPINAYTIIAYSWQLYCFRNRGIGNPLSMPVASWGILGNINFDNSGSCIHPLSAQGLETKPVRCIIVPDPVNETSRIIFPHRVSTGMLYLFNALGQTITSVPLHDQAEAIIGDKIQAPGVYYFRVVTPTNKTFSGNFIKKF